ncbi:hypothetical protein ALNOE001_19050 [Candidatus Methanobinarius endosymbioticus]|uniref:Uncharacterized protein n=1 Tax=Candidatus Methanobinarius endosymbioticus TaxID=2006182 RepID=A0A366MA90_9EURY|nr:hypothetical protein ALNOE001_19050 [Candidatus Methanobinarius endosymbioticus]
MLIILKEEFIFTKLYLVQILLVIIFIIIVVGIKLYCFTDIHNIKIDYNRIYNNSRSLEVSGNVYNSTPNINWWRTNSPITNFTDVLIDVWYVLQLSANDFSTITNASKNFSNENVI